MTDNGTLTIGTLKNTVNNGYTDTDEVVIGLADKDGGIREFRTIYGLIHNTQNDSLTIVLYRNEEDEPFYTGEPKPEENVEAELKRLRKIEEDINFLQRGYTRLESFKHESGEHDREAVYSLVGDDLGAVLSGNLEGYLATVNQ